MNKMMFCRTKMHYFLKL